MSVIVTGMDMPKSCAECQDQRCKASDEWDQFDWCDYKRVEGCQLKSINGLIDKIIERGDLYTIGGRANGKWDMRLSVRLGMEMAIEIIKEYCGVKDDKQTGNKRTLADVNTIIREQALQAGSNWTECHKPQESEG